MFTNTKKIGNNNTTTAMFFVMWLLFLALIDQSKNAKKLVRNHEILVTPQYRDRIRHCVPPAKQQDSRFTFLHTHTHTHTHTHYFCFMFSPDYQCMPFCGQQVSIDNKRHGSLIHNTIPSKQNDISP